MRESIILCRRSVVCTIFPPHFLRFQVGLHCVYSLTLGCGGGELGRLFFRLRDAEKNEEGLESFVHMNFPHFFTFWNDDSSLLTLFFLPSIFLVLPVPIAAALRQIIFRFSMSFHSTSFTLCRFWWMLLLGCGWRSFIFYCLERRKEQRRKENNEKSSTERENVRKVFIARWRKVIKSSRMEKRVSSGRFNLHIYTYKFPVHYHQLALCCLAA